MAEPSPKTIYSIDTSSLMDWQGRYYPVDVFTGIVEKVESLIVNGRMIAPALVKEEVEAVGTTELIKWVKSQSEMFVPTQTILSEALQIQSQFAGLLDPKATHEEADAYVIALAKMRGGIVITSETSASEKNKPKRTHYIPDVCRELGIPSIS